MLKFFKKTSKKLAWSAFQMWKDRKIQKAKFTVASKLDGAVDGTAKGIQFGVFGTIVLAGCGAGAFVLLPIAYCLGKMAQSLNGAENDAVSKMLSDGSCTLYTVGYVMAGVLAVILLATIIVCQVKKKGIKSRINDALRD